MAPYSSSGVIQVSKKPRDISLIWKDDIYTLDVWLDFRKGVR